jgi:hypothetical protein
MIKNKNIGGIRYDSGKPRFDLIPKQALWELAMLFNEGAKKYPTARNWESGLPFSCYISAIYRHMIKFECGEDYDGETNIHHLIAVIWNATCMYMTQIWFKLGKYINLPKDKIDDRGERHFNEFWKLPHYKSRP